MSQNETRSDIRRGRGNPPAFNAPGVVLYLILSFVAVHLLRTVILGPLQETRFILTFAFIPGLYAAAYEGFDAAVSPALLWSPLTYAFLHGNWMHLIVNTIWMLAFGAPVARRLGAPMFLLFCAFGALAGALLFALMNPFLIEPVIGASGVVSALMGGACRFAFGDLARYRRADVAFAPLLSIGEALSNRTVLFFILIFFATNLIIGSGFVAVPGAGGQVAWEAHLGGFIFGFLLFRPYDRAVRRLHRS